MSSERKPVRYGCFAVVVITVCGGVLIAVFSSRDDQTPKESASTSITEVDKPPLQTYSPGTLAPSASPPPPPPPSSLTLAEMKAADWPPSIALRKSATFRFKKGAYVTIEKKAPLFFGAEYLRDGQAGTQLEVLEYNPEKLRVYCRSKDERGNTIAINILESHLKSEQGVTVPPGTVVGADRLVGSNVWVTYDGARKAIPVSDTDLLEQAKLQRNRNELEARRQAEQADRERRAHEDAARQAMADQRRQEDEAAQDKIRRLGPKPVASLFDHTYPEIKEYLRVRLRDPDSIKFYQCSDPILADDAWVIACDYGAKNGFGGMNRIQEWFVIRAGHVIDVKDADAYNFTPKQ